MGARLRTLGKVRNPSVDAPSRSRGNFRIILARSRMLPSVRPLMRT
jgi:hypothetical protein